MGGGSRLHLAYKKYGMENFTKEILKFFNSRKDAAEYEAEIVNEILIKDTNCYNIVLGGGNGTVGTLTVSKDGKEWLNVPRNDPRYLSGELKTFRQLYIYVTDNKGNILTVKNTDPRYISGELISIHKNYTTAKDNNGNFYYININDPKYLSGELIPLWKGKKHKQETKYKVKKTLKEINHQQGEKNSQFGTCWIHNNQENKKIKKDELQQWLNDGWIKGRKFFDNKDRTKENNSVYGKSWYHNDLLKQNKFFNNNDNIPENWIKGRKQYKF